MLNEIRAALKNQADPKKAAFFPRYFKAGPGEYAEGDKFLGVTVPRQRLIAKEFYKTLSLENTLRLLEGDWHEERLTALLILVLKYQRGNEATKEDIVHAYFANTKYVNNWDLVDSSAPYILGNWLLNKDRVVLYEFAKSDLLWERRIAIIATLEFIRNSEFDDTLKLAELLLNDKQDLIHKATGWALRELGKSAPELLLEFLNKHASLMPRTTLRYSIERLSPDERKHYLTLKQ
jgi:3-methyladenine DNA glycosylase AlkD